MTETNFKGATADLDIASFKVKQFRVFIRRSGAKMNDRDKLQ